MRRSGLGVWVGGGAVQFFGEDGDAEVARLDALDLGSLRTCRISSVVASARNAFLMWRRA